MRALASLRRAGSARGEGRRAVGLALALIVLLALGLRLARLTFQPLWWDEGWSLYFAASDVPSLLDLTSVDIHPPLYYLLLRLWEALAGSGVVSVRLFSVLIGTAAVPLIYLLGRRMLGRRGGLLAALLLALSPFHVYYSQEVRMYGLVTLLGLAAFYFAHRWASRPWATSRGPGWGSLLGYALAAAAALYTQYYVAFLLLGLNLALALHWLRRRPPAAMLRRRAAAWLAAQAAVLLLFLPWLVYAAGRLATYVRFKVGVEADPSLGPLAYLGRHLAAFAWGHLAGLEGWWWLGLLPLALLLAGLALWRLAPGRESGTEPAGDGRADVWTWAGAVAGVALVCGFLVNLALPFNPPRSERLLLLALPAFLLLVSGGLLALWRARRALALPARGRPDPAPGAAGRRHRLRPSLAGGLFPRLPARRCNAARAGSDAAAGAAPRAAALGR
ncbi:MAG: glycosyltransferase family 39 protein [Anaerolineae bacterium]